MGTGGIKAARTQPASSTRRHHHTERVRWLVLEAIISGAQGCHLTLPILHRSRQQSRPCWSVRPDRCDRHAGYGLFDPFETATDEQIRRQLATHVDGIFTATRAVLPVMRRQAQRQRETRDVRYESTAPGQGILLTCEPSSFPVTVDLSTWRWPMCHSRRRVLVSFS